LFSALTAWPAPSGPQWKICVPIFARIGRARSTSFSAPPTMIASVASFALAMAPDTGASIIAMPCAASARPSAREPAGSAELMSRTSAPSLRAGSASSTTPRTTFPSGNIVMRTSASFAASRTERRLPLPFASNDCSA